MNPITCLTSEELIPNSLDFYHVYKYNSLYIRDTGDTVIILSKYT